MNYNPSDFGSLLMPSLLIELIQLLETMLVDQLFQMAVGVMADHAMVVKDHHHAVLGGIGFPLGQTIDIGVAGVGKLSPGTAHEVGQCQILLAGLRQFVLGMMQRIEAKLQFVSML